MDREGDRRVRKTEKQLCQGLTKLLQQKNIKDITIKELCDLTDMNRGTFYLHYPDIYALLESIERAMFDGFHGLLDKYASKESIENPLPLLTEIFQFAAENREMCLILLGENGDIGFVDKMRNEIKSRCLNDWTEIINNGNTENFEYFYSFIVSGSVGFLQQWLESGMKVAPEKMAALLKEMIMADIDVLHNAVPE